MNRYLGVVKNAAENTLAAFQKMCSTSEDLQLRLRVLSERLRHVPRFKCRNKQSRKFASGVLSFDFEKMTGEDYLHLLTQLPLVFGECAVLLLFYVLLSYSLIGGAVLSLDGADGDSDGATAFAAYCSDADESSSSSDSSSSDDGATGNVSPPHRGRRVYRTNTSRYN